LHDYLNTLPLPKLTCQQTKYIDSTITQYEKAEAIQSLPLGLKKSPGPDGLTAEFYKQFVDVLAPRLTEVFNSTLEEETPLIPSSCYRAIITLILMDGKDTYSYESYTPISLINTDTKIVSIVLANRLIKLITSLT
uniref:Reverse transcriptase domain-containing protein n=1 Tax=Xenopus tropicalis TaxID=8364 RepID=A0A803JSI2_XENTR